MSYSDIIIDIQKAGNPVYAKHSLRFFKCGPGEYGEGDEFCGIRVPEQRFIAKKHKDLSMPEIGKLLNHKIHECRLIALMILCQKFKKADEKKRAEIYAFYRKHHDRVNNWDLVDCSAPNIPGPYLLNKNRKDLYALAKSNSMWERRIAIISTHAFIKADDIDDTLKISALLLGDKEDLLHKAVGWMLREAAKKNQPRVEAFLKTHYAKIPRTALRYAIERFPEPLRKRYLKGNM